MTVIVKRAGRLVAAVAAAGILVAAFPALAQDAGEWRYIGGDAGHTRYSPLDQVTADNFEDLEVAWIWRGDNFGPGRLGVSRSTPIYVDGTLYTVAGERRTVAAIDPATGETLWTFREPHTTRFDRGMRNGYGKGVAYGEIDGRGVIYTISPAFFLYALDARTGLPLEDWGTPVPLPGFPGAGVVDLLPDLIADWGPWQSWDGAYDPDFGIPRELGYVTSSSPPIVVNGVVVVGNSAEQGYNQTRIENVPGDILGYDARTGDHKWKFNVIPRPGELGHETMGERRLGVDRRRLVVGADVGRPRAGARLRADEPADHRLLRRVPPRGRGCSAPASSPSTSRPASAGGTSRPCTTDIWNFDNPTAPVALDVTVEGRPRRIVVQATKQGWAYTFDRATGEPVWPIEERPVPQSEVPGERLSPTQPMPTRPAAYEMQGLTEDDLIDFTPELRAEAVEIARNYRLGPIFNPPIQRGHPSGLRSFVSCPSGASNIFGPTSADPETGILYVSTRRGCRSENIVPGALIDVPEDIKTTGRTIAEFAVLNRGDFRGPQGLPIYKPPYARIVAIDMNTGDHLWETPNGDTPERIRNHPALQGVDLPNTGRDSHPVTMVTRTLLITAEGTGGTPRLHALDKRTGERVGTVELPASGQYGMMGYLHEGRQYIVVQVAGAGLPGSLAALRLP